MSALDEATNVILLQDELDFRDIDNDPIRLGNLVRYTEDREEPWTQNRWGIVTGMARTVSIDGIGYDESVRVTTVDVSDESRSRWHNNEWFAGPQKLRVIK